MLIPLSQLISPTDKIGESVAEHAAIFAPTTLEYETALVPHCSAYGETTVLSASDESRPKTTAPETKPYPAWLPPVNYGPQSMARAQFNHVEFGLGPTCITRLLAVSSEKRK
jgi:hypothetical protein